MDTNTTNNKASLLSVDFKVLISDLWRGVIKFGWVALVCAVLLGGVQFYRSYVNFVPSYSVSATFTVHTENVLLSGENGVSAYSFYYDRSTADQLAKVFPYIVNNPVLQEQVCDDLDVQYMPATISASCVSETNMVTLTAKGKDPQMTYDTLNSVIENYSSVADHIIGRTKLIMINEPILPENPVNANQWYSSVLKGAAVGLAIGVVWIVVYALLRKTIRVKDDVKDVLNQHCLGVVPQVVFKKYRRKINTDIILTNPHIGSDFLESLRLLRYSVQGSLGNNEKVVMITSTASKEGKSTITLNLASVFAKNENKILVVDFDLRNDGIKALLENETITEKRKDNGFAIERVDSLNFDLLTFEKSVSSVQRVIRNEFLSGKLADLKNEYDLIFIDTPPCGTISDALTIAEFTDAILYVIKQDSVIQSSIRTCVNDMLETNSKFLGCIINGATSGLGGYGEYYNYSGYYKYYRYGYGYSKKYGYGYGKKSK